MLAVLGGLILVAGVVMGLTCAAPPSSTAGRGRYEDTLRSLRGHPVVINKWACRAEFPIFQQFATERGREVACRSRGELEADIDEHLGDA